MKKILPLLLLMVNFYYAKCQKVEQLNQTRKYILNQFSANTYVELSNHNFLLIKEGDKRAVYLFNDDGLCVVIGYDIDISDKETVLDALMKDGFKKASSITMRAPADFLEKGKDFPVDRYTNNTYVFSFFGVSIKGEKEKNSMVISQVK